MTTQPPPVWPARRRPGDERRGLRGAGRRGGHRGHVLPLVSNGYGHFTTLLSEDSAARGLDLHLERLRADGALLFGRPPAPEPRVKQLLRRAARHAPRSIVRATVFAPAMGVADPGADHPLGVLGTTREAPEPGLADGGLRLRGVEHQRDLPGVEHTGLLAALHHRWAARRDGFDDAVFLGRAGEVLEGPTWNVGFCSPAGQVVWPTGPRLDGVMMALLHRAVDGSAHATVPWPDLRGAAPGWTAFVTSAVAGMRPVASIDGVALDARSDLVERLQRTCLALPAQQI